MSFVFTTNIFDIAKSAIGIGALILLVIFIPRLMDKYDSEPALDKTTIEFIAKNAVEVTLANSKIELKQLLKELKKENSLAIKEALDDNAKIKEIASFMATMKGKTEPDPEVEHTPSGDEGGARDLEEFTVYRDDAEGNPFPVGIIRISPNVKSGPKYSYQEFPLDFKANIISAEKGEQEKRYAEIWVESNFVKSSRGVKHPIDLKNVRWAMAKPNDKKWNWNPRLSLGSSFTNTTFYPSLGMSLFSYGRTNRDMDWKFMGFSLGGDSDNFYGDFTPFEWNMGTKVPLVENLFIGPNISYGISTEDGIEDNISYGLKFSVPF